MTRPSPNLSLHGLPLELPHQPTATNRPALPTWLPIIACLGLAACAHAPAPGAQTPDAAAVSARDPAEKVNRTVFAVNHAVDRAAIAPVARGYAKAAPATARKGLKNFTSNLKGPGIFINDVLQANFSRAGATSARFVVNSTVGVGGLFDVGDRLGLPFHEADMGQTFGRWGMPPGPSLQVPLLGPSNLRDFGGGLIGTLLDPATYLTGGAATAISVIDGIDMVDSRAELLPMTDELQRSEPDYYAALRDRSAEGRAAMIEEAKVGVVKPVNAPQSGAPLPISDPRPVEVSAAPS